MLPSQRALFDIPRDICYLNAASWSPLPIVADQLRNGEVTISDAAVRAPHILSLQFPGGMPERLVQQLATERVYVAPRIGRMRVSPHVYNDEDDVDRFVATFSG
jgi:selenocysteine lyase/cysteine desulfurase